MSLLLELELEETSSVAKRRPPNCTLLLKNPPILDQLLNSLTAAGPGIWWWKVNKHRSALVSIDRRALSHSGWALDYGHHETRWREEAFDLVSMMKRIIGKKRLHCMRSWPSCSFLDDVFLDVYELAWTKLHDASPVMPMVEKLLYPLKCWS